MKDNLVDAAVCAFECLQGHGFQPARVFEDRTQTTVCWLHNHISLELEFDWRENAIFLLVVRLENGNRPNRYYASNGVKCRIHIQEMIARQRWSVDESAISKITTTNAKSGRLSDDSLLILLQAYSALLISVLDSLVEAQHSLFE